MFDRIVGRKKMFLCGDFNVDLLNPQGHKGTSEFIYVMHSLGLIPTITKPSRVTAYCATLIDNIYSNVMDTAVSGGLLIEDISDHLPIFAIYHSNHKLKTPEPTTEIRKRRMRTPGTVEAFKADLLKQNWKNVYVNGVQEAYSSFLATFIQLYDKNCPMMIYNVKDKNKQQKCWMTKGLLNACKKKNTLYREFIKHRTENVELKYKVYKNKLTKILRTRKEAYYSSRLEKNRDNMRGTWKVIYSLLKNKNPEFEYPKYIMKKICWLTKKKTLLRSLMISL